MDAAVKIKSLELDKTLMEETAQCVRKVFKEGFGIDLIIKSAVFGTVEAAEGDISGVVGLVQNRFEGSMILSFKQDVIFDILKRVYETEFESIDSIVMQGAAELANMIYGLLKSKLNSRGHCLQMALPNVIVGKNHNVHSAQDCRFMKTTFEYNNMSFNLYIALLRI